MKNLEYKGYTGTIEYSKEDELLFGKVIGIKSLLSYEGSTGTELEVDFKGVIDEYLEDCKVLNTKPEKPFKGSFNVRIPSELHRDAALKAMELNTSLNGFVSESIRARLLQRV
jgi:predicted HicB family RNase H-like nuclease